MDPDLIRELARIHLRQQAREAIRTGKLPARVQDRTLGGPGTGATCAVCGGPITPNMTELELEFEHHSAMPGADSYRLHHLCFAAWDSERHESDNPNSSRGAITFWL